MALTTILVGGPRGLDGIDQRRLEADIRRFFREMPSFALVIHGNARGVDRICAREALAAGHLVRSFPVKPEDADAAEAAGESRWKAPLYRTRRMFDTCPPDRVVVWWDGKSTGTGFTLGEARRRSVPTVTKPVLRT